MHSSFLGSRLLPWTMKTFGGWTLLSMGCAVIAGADQSTAGVSRVRVSIVMFPPGGTESVVRFTVLPVAGQAAKPAP